MGSTLNPEAMFSVWSLFIASDNRVASLFFYGRRKVRRRSKLGLNQASFSQDFSHERSLAPPLFVRTWTSRVAAVYRRRNFVIRSRASISRRRYPLESRDQGHAPRVANLFSRTPAFSTDGLRLRRATALIWLKKWQQKCTRALKITPKMFAMASKLVLGTLGKICFITT